MADGTQFKGAMRCDVELPYKLWLMRVQESRISESERKLQTLQQNPKISTTSLTGKLPFWFGCFFQGVIRR